MCGLYAVLHFLQTAEGWTGTPPGETLWYVLDACRHHGWLNPYLLTEGFEDFQLKAILDLQIANYRLEYKTYFLTDVARSIKCSSARSLIRRVVDKGGAVITGPKGRSHWFLVTSSDGKAVVYDSGAQDDEPYPLEDVARISVDDSGVVILPHPRDVFQVEI